MSVAERPAALINIVMTVVLGGALLYLLNRLRSVETELCQVKDAVRQTANLDDVVDMTRSLVEQGVAASRGESDAEGEERKKESDAEEGD